MIVDGQVGAEGLRDLHRALKRMDRQLGKDLQTKIKGVAQIVADEAKRIAPRSRRPGRHMADLIRVGIRGSTGVVRAIATRKSARWPKGYRYPYEIEFGGRLGTTDVGPRAFLAPALAAKTDEVVRGMERILDDLADTWESRA